MRATDETVGAGKDGENHEEADGKREIFIQIPQRERKRVQKGDW